MRAELSFQKADGPIVAHWLVEYSVDYLITPAEKLFRTIEEAREFIATLEGGE